MFQGVEVSTNFIVLLAEDTVEELLKLIVEQKPDYVVIKRIDKTDDNQISNVYHYCYFASFLRNFIIDCSQRALTQPRIFEFLNLRETDSIELKELSDGDNKRDDEIKEIIKTRKKNIIPLVIKNKIIGLIHVESEGGGMGKPKGIRQNRIDPVYPPHLAKRVPKSRNKNLKKFATAKLRDKLQVGKEESFVVQLKGAESSSPLTFEVPIEIDPNQLEPNATQAELDVEALCDPPYIADIVGKRKQLMVVPLGEGDSNSVSFKIIPKEKGFCKVTARIYYRKTNLEVGTIQLTRSVGTERGSKEPTSASNVNMTRKRISPDVVMKIIRLDENQDQHDRQNDNKFEYIIEIRAFEKLGIFDKPFTKIKLEHPVEYFKKIFQQIEAFNPQDYSILRAKREIESIGKKLWEDLIPDDFKEYYWTTMREAEIKSIHILSSEPWIPWEVIKPYNDDDEDEFLCEKFAITRWISSCETPQKPYIRTIKLVRPQDSNLPSDETKWIENEFKNACSRVSSFEQLDNSLRDEDFDLLHFSTHGKFEENKDPADSYVELENKEPFKAGYIDGQSCPSIRRNHPLVILNACETGKTGFSLTGLGGWAERFIKSEAFGFIGTLWSISDTMAYNFTKSLYQNLKKAIPLNEAVRKARIDVKENAKEKGDPSWLAYCLYAPPNDAIQITK